MAGIVTSVMDAYWNAITVVKTQERNDWSAKQKMIVHNEIFDVCI